MHFVNLESKGETQIVGENGWESLTTQDTDNTIRDFEWIGMVFNILVNSCSHKTLTAQQQWCFV